MKWQSFIRYLQVFPAALMVMLLVGMGSLSAFEAVSTDDDGVVAIQGYDTVAYFTENKAVRGEQNFNHIWEGARWLFSSAGHRDLFAQNPRKYAPRYGGFCSGAMQRGAKVRSDPQAWKIIDGKLYLNYTKVGIERFAADAENSVPIADANWQQLKERGD